MRSHSPKIIPEMLTDLQKIGLACGDVVIVHSSFKALGVTDSSPSDVIHTIAHLLGPDGTLMMPTFTYSYSGIWHVAPFDPDETPGISNGVLSETLRKFPGALRSAHPTYSVAAIGKHAERITKDKENAAPLGRGSSYGIALELNARILLIGVGNDRNSLLHYAEVMAGLPYNDIPFREFWGRTAIVKKGGEITECPLPDEFPGCSDNFGVVDPYLEEKGILAPGKIGSADSSLMSAHDMVNAVVEKLHQEPAWLLCDNFTCEPCTLRKKRLKEAGLI